MIKINPNFTYAKKANNSQNPQKGQSYLLNSPVQDSVSFGNGEYYSQQQRPEDNLLGWALVGVGLAIGGFVLSRSLKNPQNLPIKTHGIPINVNVEVRNVEDIVKSEFTKGTTLHEITPKRNNSVGSQYFQNPSEFVRSEEFDKLRDRTCNVDFLENLYNALKAKNEKQNSPEIQVDIVKVLNKLDSVREARKLPGPTETELRAQGLLPKLEVPEPSKPKRERNTVKPKANAPVKKPAEPVVKPSKEINVQSKPIGFVQHSVKETVDGPAKPIAKKTKTPSAKVTKKKPPEVVSHGANANRVKPKAVVTVNTRLNEEADLAIDISNASPTQEGLKKNRKEINLAKAEVIRDKFKKTRLDKLRSKLGLDFTPLVYNKPSKLTYLRKNFLCCINEYIGIR